MRNRWFLNNYLNGNDMWPYVTMWEYEERIIPLQKIVDIFHESGNQKLKCYEAYSVAGEIGFGWWLVEHYLPYHVNRPNGCDSGEPTRGR